jgi:cephalosporin hydroxylase
MITEKTILTNIKAIIGNTKLLSMSTKWLQTVVNYNYVYNFTWLGRPIIQVPQDMYAVQELIWKVQPDLIIETGIAHGGSLILSASMLGLIDHCNGYSLETTIRHVIGIDIDIRPHNLKAIKEHPLSSMITLIQGSSIDSDIITQVEEKSKRYKRIMVFLDSNHTHEHVLSELKAYTPLVAKDSYCVVWDTVIADAVTQDINRPWGKGNNPRTALHEFLKDNNQFEIDDIISHKLLITASIDGFLKRIK